MAPASPVTPAEFAGLMDRLGPFEAAPALALAVSGGADSMALALLAKPWATARDGDVTALIVDHALRPEAATEAQLTQARLQARGIAAEILTRSGPMPTGDLQAFARAARYRLLRDWCQARGILHLVTAHHRDDQAETLLLRLARGSGLAGLAAMPAIAHLDACRLLRPLLAIAPERLRATLNDAGETWIDDPSNRNEAFARARLRGQAGSLAALGLAPERLAATARHLGRARAAIEDQVARLLAAGVAIHPAGFATLTPAAFATAPADIALRALAATVTCIGGQATTPRFVRLETLWSALRSGKTTPRTLSGCRIVPQGNGVLIFRELAAIAPPLSLGHETRVLRWDNRFEIALPEIAGAEELELGALDTEPATGLRGLPGQMGRDIPARVWPTLPTLRRKGTILAVPHLAWVAPEAADEIGPFDVMARFSPERALTECGFTVV